MAPLESPRSGVLLTDDPGGFEGPSDPLSPDSLLQGSMDPRGPPTPHSSPLPFRLPGIPQLWDRPYPLFPPQGSWGSLSLLSWGVPKTNVLPPPVSGDHHMDPQISSQRRICNSALRSCRIQTSSPKKPSPFSNPQRYLGLDSQICKLHSSQKITPLEDSLMCLVPSSHLRDGTLCFSFCSSSCSSSSSLPPFPPTAPPCPPWTPLS